jgi:predicted kinase
MEIEGRTFTLVSGVQAAGKTTWVQQMADEHPDVVVISSDDRIEKIALAKGLTYQEAYVRHADEVLASLFVDARTALLEGRPVMWDQTNLTVAARAERLSLVPEGYIRQAVTFEIDETEQKRRLDERRIATGKSIPDFVIKLKRAEYVRPTAAEGFDRVWVSQDGKPELCDENVGAPASLASNCC